MRFAYITKILNPKPFFYKSKRMLFNQSVVSMSGNLRLKFNFGVAPGHFINILVYGEFQTTLEIDPNGAVIYAK